MENGGLHGPPFSFIMIGMTKTHHTPFWLQGLHVDGPELARKTMTETVVWKGNDPRPVVFRGDAYWQWFSDSPYRDRGKGFCWTQALHDGLEGFHACILHSGNDKFCVHPQHPDYEHVARMWDLAQEAAVPADF